MEDDALMLKCIIRSVIREETDLYVKSIARIGLFLYSKILRINFLKQRNATIKIQSLLKMHICKKTYLVKLRKHKENLQK